MHNYRQGAFRSPPDETGGKTSQECQEISPLTTDSANGSLFVSGSLGFSAASPRTALLGGGLAIHLDLRGLVLLLDGLDTASQSSLGLDLSLHLLLFGLVVTALILGNTVEDVVGQNAQDQEEPEEVDGLQTSKQGKGDVLTDPALVLLCFPVELKGTDSTELGQDSPEDLQVEDMAEVNPRADEHAEVGNGDVGIEVVQCFRSLLDKSVLCLWVIARVFYTYRQEKVRHVMGNVHGKTHVREVETVAQRNECQGDDMVANQLLEILSGLLQLQQKHNGLLSPVTRLEKVVRLEESLVFSVGEILKHSSGVEVPNFRTFHHVQAKWAKDAEVDRRVDLLHKASSLALAPDTAEHRQRPDELLHDELSRKGQHHGVKCDKRDILFAFSVHGGTAGVFGRLRVGKEDRVVHRIRRAWVDSIE